MRPSLALLLLLLALAPTAAQDDSSVSSLSNSSEPLLGADADEHGCVGSSGHTWCETLGACVREWEGTGCPDPCEDGEALYRDLGSGECVALTRCNETEAETLAPTATVRNSSNLTLRACVQVVSDRTLAVTCRPRVRRLPGLGRALDAIRHGLARACHRLPLLRHRRHLRRLLHAGARGHHRGVGALRGRRRRDLHGGKHLSVI